MNTWEADQLVLFIAFVVAGFAGLNIHELLFRRLSNEPAGQLIDLAYSSANYPLLLWPCGRLPRSRDSALMHEACFPREGADQNGRQITLRRCLDSKPGVT